MTIPRAPRSATTSRPLRSDARYESIIATAEQLIHDRGYHAVSMRDLAQAVGIQMSSLYHYFQSKEHILYGISRHTMESLIEATNAKLLEHHDEPVEARLRLAIIVGVEFHIDYQHAAGVVLSESRKLSGEFRTELRQLLRDYETIFRSLVEEGMDCGAFVRRDSAMATYIMLSALTRISIWYRPSGRLPAARIADEYSDLLMRMVSAGEAAGSGNGPPSSRHLPKAE